MLYFFLTVLLDSIQKSIGEVQELENGKNYADFDLILGEGCKYF